MRQVSPPSSDRQICPRSVGCPFQGIPSPVSISAYMRLGFEGAMATPTLPTPTDCFGIPLMIRIHVVPPSRERNSPLPGPPLSYPQACTSTCHIPARTMRGFFGFMAMSEQPVFSSTNSTRSQLLPPSVVRNTPRSCWGP